MASRELEASQVAARVVSVARRLTPLGLTQGTSGNVSARVPGGMLITPSAVPYDVMEADDVVEVPLDGTAGRRDGADEHAEPGAAPQRSARGRRPSTEWRMHAGILRARPDVDAIVHAHPANATALSCLRRRIPPFHYMVAIAGGTEIRCADYATFGTEELARAAVEALGDRRACLLANHGIIACGTSVDAALGLAVEVEALAGQYLRALSVGEPVLLGEREMADVLRGFESYGR